MTRLEDTDAFSKKLTDVERARLKKMIAGASLGEVAAQLGLAVQTLRSLAGGCEGRRGTISLIRSRMK